MARGDGKNKFYRLLDLPKDVKALLKIYNKIWKKQACTEIKGTADSVHGKTY